jgi:outer membrane lipoprotein-sorting protein
MLEYSKAVKKHMLFVLVIAALCFGCTGNKAVSDVNLPEQVTVKANSAPDANKIDTILTKLDRQSRQLKTYEARIIYTIKQPVLESEILRSGMLYYINDENGSKLRINFTTQRQDSEPVPNSREDYFFDGVNLTRIDYKLKNVEYRQLTDANRPLNAFDLASRYLPIVGFAKADKLREDFEISILPTTNTDKEYYQLLLKTRPQSQHMNDYTQIRFWIDAKASLPVRIEATSPQEDIYDIRLEEAKVNKPLAKDVFTVEVPADFGKNMVPIEKEQK